jgi:diguanylate cyclase
MLETLLRYKETKEQSAELLRRVLALMGQHDAAFNPVSFTVWYEFASGINTRLAQAIEELTQKQARLTDELIGQLYQTYVADVDPAAMHRISGEFQRVMVGMAESALRTGDHAGAFGEQLQGLSAALTNQDVTAMSALVTQALADTALMRSSAQALQQQLLTSRQEMDLLQQDLVRARDEAVLDPLTRVLNRKGFDQQLALMLAEPTEPGKVHGLIMLDIDHFKKVNDTHGHVMGDRVIQALGEVLRNCVTDATHSCARYGGEEFAILMPQSTREAAMALAEIVRLKTRSMKIRDRRTQEVVLTVTVSAGVAVLKPGDDAQALVERADAALYQSKQTGRDRVTGA